MEPYQPVSRAVYDALEELYLLKEEANFTFMKNFQQKTLLHMTIIDLHEEEDGEFLIFDNNIRIRLDQLLAINGKPVQFFA